jgi:serine/threonine-protein kinase
VYAATHRNGKRVAIKVLHAEHSHRADVRERFLEEGYAANRVGHPGIASILDDGVMDDGAAFLVMDLLDGETLAQRFERSDRPLGAEEVLSIADQVLSVLAAAHASGIVHRDIKPENIFVTRAGDVKVVDFGIAHVTDSRLVHETIGSFTMGTPAFMPPEQALGQTDLIDGRTDLWALGATMYWLLSGKPVHEAGTANEELLQAMTMSVPSLRALPDIDDVVAELVDRALEFDVEKRWEDALAMQQAVRRAYADLTGSDPLHTIPPEAARAASLPPRSDARERFPHADDDSVAAMLRDTLALSTAMRAAESPTSPTSLRPVTRSRVGLALRTQHLGLAVLALGSLFGVGFVALRLVTHVTSAHADEGTASQPTPAAFVAPAAGPSAQMAPPLPSADTVVPAVDVVKTDAGVLPVEQRRAKPPPIRPPRRQAISWRHASHGSADAKAATGASKPSAAEAPPPANPMGRRK